MEIELTFEKSKTGVAGMVTIDDNLIVVEGHTESEVEQEMREVISNFHDLSDYTFTTKYI